MSYNHRPLGSNSAALQSQSGGREQPAPHLGPQQGLSGSSHSATRLTDLLDFVRQEFEGVASEANSLRAQNSEYENHAHGHTKEVSALRHTMAELESLHKKRVAELEAQNEALQRELDHRSAPGSATERQQPVLPAPQVASGSASIFGSLPQTQHQHPPPSTSAPDHPANSGAYHSSSAHSTAADRLPMIGPGRDGDPPHKRPRLDTDPGHGGGAQPPYLAARPPSSLDKHPQQQQQPPQAGQAHAYARAPPPLAGRPGPPQLPPQQQQQGQPQPEAPAEGKEGRKDGGADWMTMYNPKVKRTLDVELVHNLMHDSVVCCVRFSPDGKLLATGCNRVTVLYNTATGQRHCTLVDPSVPPSGDNYIRSTCFSQDGKLLATGSEDRKIRVWDVAARKLRHTLEGHMNEIYSLVFSHDGRLLYSGSGDQTARAWDVETGAPSWAITIDDASPSPQGAPVDAGVTSVALSPSGRLLAAGSLDTVVRIWDVATGKLVDRLRGHKDSVYSVAFAPDGSWLVSGSLDKTLRLWDLAGLNAHMAGGPPVLTMAEDKKDGPEAQLVSSTACTSTLSGHKDYVLSVAVSPDGQWIVSGSKDRGVSFWDPKATVATVVLQGHKNSVISIAVSEVGGLLATGSGDWTCRLWKYGPSAAPAQA